MIPGTETQTASPGIQEDRGDDLHGPETAPRRVGMKVPQKPGECQAKRSGRKLPKPARKRWR